MIQTEEKVLVFSSRETCYNSNRFFANQAAAAFEKLGYETEVCEFTREDDLDEVLTPYIGKKYKVILDFNSLMTRMTEEDGTPFLDRIDGPFYDYVLDHPLFHYNSLTAKLKNLNAILLDEAQKSYVKRFYKGVNKVLMMPLGATVAVSQEKQQKRAECILFMGTYDRPEDIYKAVEASLEPLRTHMKHLIEMRIADPKMSMEDGLSALLLEKGILVSDDVFASLMNAMYLVDMYVRDYFRKAAVDSLAERRIPVRLVGEGWQKYEHFQENYIMREREVSFGFSFEKIAKEHILLNSSPIFNHGAHDRIYAGMANHCAVLTDENPYLQKTLKDGENVILYSLKEAGSLCDRAEELLTNPAFCREIQEAAYQEYLCNHTWEKRMQNLLNSL